MQAEREELISDLNAALRKCPQGSGAQTDQGECAKAGMAWLAQCSRAGPCCGHHEDSKGDSWRLTPATLLIGDPSITLLRCSHTSSNDSRAGLYNIGVKQYIWLFWCACGIIVYDFRSLTFSTFRIKCMYLFISEISTSSKARSSYSAVSY